MWIGLLDTENGNMDYLNRLHKFLDDAIFFYYFIYVVLFVLVSLSNLVELVQTLLFCKSRKLVFMIKFPLKLNNLNNIQLAFIVIIYIVI